MLNDLTRLVATTAATAATSAPATTPTGDFCARRGAMASPFSALWPAMMATVFLLLLLALSSPHAAADERLPIADVHVHYSHDSVDMTPPERVIELMRGAGLHFALVSSSDDNGTQLLSEAAPDLIVPGLRPYRRRGELSSWFTDPAALEYVERLLATNTYASIGEFHLYGADAEKPIPRRLVELADEHNLVLHAHSDADAVTRLLAQSETVKVLWAHSGFDSPAVIADMLDRHPRLWADLAFRGEVGSGGSLSDEWRELFIAHPDRMMLGTDTYTPERMYFLPEHAAGARTWLATLPADIAERIAWRNAHDLLMPIWQSNRARAAAAKSTPADPLQATLSCDDAGAQGSDSAAADRVLHAESDGLRVALVLPTAVDVSAPFDVDVIVCSNPTMAGGLQVTGVDARMPAHGHGTNYEPELNVVDANSNSVHVNVAGMVLHMPGAWEWTVDVVSDTASGDAGSTTKTATQHRLTFDYQLQ